MRRYSALDRLITGFDQTLQSARSATPSRPNPSAQTETPPLSASESRHAAGLMRVNHAGEIAAQALYLAQAATARTAQVRAHLLEAAQEERDHLHWCEQRLNELNSQPSRLAPLWFAGSYGIGLLAGLTGDANSLGFVAETERQVGEHLESHLKALPERDLRSRRIVRTMRDEEASHGAAAMDAGGRALPPLIQRIMRATAKVMTRVAYWV